MAKKILFAIPVFILIFCAYFYLVIRTVYFDVSAQQPFVEYINKTYPLLQGGRIVKLRDANKRVADWAFFELSEAEKDPNQRQQFPELVYLEPGAKIKIISAHLVQSGVSGFTDSIVEMEATVKGETYRIEYYWGADPDLLNKDQGGKRNFQFKAPPWDLERETQIVPLEMPKRFFIL